jgi:hypothetical protein
MVFAAVWLAVPVPLSPEIVDENLEFPLFSKQAVTVKDRTTVAAARRADRRCVLISIISWFQIPQLG